MPSYILQQVKNELLDTVKKIDHPYRFFYFATVDETKPAIRTVVLRKFLNDFTLEFYTDFRSNKIDQLKKNANGTALFYHPEKRIQILFKGKVVVCDDKELLDNIWNSIPNNSKKEYTTALRPGSPLKSPEDVTYSDGANHFCKIKLVPECIEYLRLKRPNHMRAEFTKEGKEWKGTFLVP